MNFPSHLKYTQSDEWVGLDGKGATLGITDFAQSQLSDIVYVEVTADVGASLRGGDPVASVESVKAASEVYLPVAGTILEVNEALASNPEVLNKDPYGAAWMVKFTPADPKALEGLMDAKAYEAYCAEREH
jgi:glycine cleavage system H protein